MTMRLEGIPSLFSREGCRATARRGGHLCNSCFACPPSSLEHLASLSHVSLFKLLLNISDKIVLISVPVRRDKQAERRLAKHSLNHDVRIQPFHEVTEQVKVLFVLQHTKRLTRIFGSES